MEPIKIPIAAVKPNPWQARKNIDAAEVAQLADSIESQGFWNTPLRVRKNGTGYQLVWGHVRLRALQQLGRETVLVEVVELDDTQMCEQGLAENLARTGLLELDRAEGIAKLVQMEMAKHGEKSEQAIERVKKLLGYDSTHTISSYVLMAAYSPKTKKILREKNMGRRLVEGAAAIGGEPFVEFVAREGISKRDIDKIHGFLAELPIGHPRQRVIDRIMEKGVTEPSKIKEMVRAEAERLSHKEHIPPDLMEFVIHWTLQLEKLTEDLRAAGKHKEYIRKHPTAASKFKTASETFIGVLKATADI